MDLEPETKLFRAIINQALEDILEPDDETKPFEVWATNRRRIRTETPRAEQEAYNHYVDVIAARNRSFGYRRREAIAWLTGGSKDFRFVCRYADLDPSYVMMKVRSSELLRPYLAA